MPDDKAISQNQIVREAMGVAYDPDQPYKDNKAYWDNQTLAEVGRLKEEFEFLPGRFVELKTIDIQESSILGRFLDKEVGKIDFSTGMPSSFQETEQWFSIAMSLCAVDRVSTWTPTNQRENPDNIDLSKAEREAAIVKRFGRNLSVIQGWTPWMVRRVYAFYDLLRKRQKEAVDLLPKYSEHGDPLTTLSASSVTPVPGEGE